MEMRKIVINNCYGGFDLSQEALEILGVEYADEIERDNPHLVELIEKMGSETDGICSALKIVEIPADVDWVIEEYDGMEWVAERHRVWS